MAGQSRAVVGLSCKTQHVRWVPVLGFPRKGWGEDLKTGFKRSLGGLAGRWAEPWGWSKVVPGAPAEAAPAWQHRKPPPFSWGIAEPQHPGPQFRDQAAVPARVITVHTDIRGESTEPARQ